MKKFILAALATTTIAAALPTVALAESANSVTVTKFHQSYPYSGRATVEYTVGGTLPANAIAEFTITTDDDRISSAASATFVQSNIVAGANTNVIDFASSFGGALVLTNASFTVTIKPDDDLGGVQLWAGGPYWAECNVGASTPEEYGYYFWWGDTVGYTRSGGTWNDYGYGDGSGFYSGVTWVSSTDQQMGSSPFTDSACPTYGINDAALQSAGYIDSTGNLVAAHDAATAHLGAPWRMPTDAEHNALINNCDWTWTTKNGVNGYEVRGRGDYASNSIFLPAAGEGWHSNLSGTGSYGYYWLSTPYEANSDYASQFYFSSGEFRGAVSVRLCGQSVRPIRESADAVCSASGVVTRDPVLIVIESVADWDALSAAVAGGLETEGVLVLLANDVGPVTNMVGDSVHPFAGVFNGNGHTLTVAISGTGDCAAPFSVIDGATISNLVVTGTVAGGNHSAGLVGTCGATGPNVIRDCTVSVAVSGTGYLGGIVGHGGQGTLSFEGCVFSGAVSGFTAFAGGLMGWSNSMALNVTNCLSAGTFAPAGGGTYHPIACKRANQTVTAAVADAYWIHTVVPTTMGGYLIPGAEGTPVSATLVAGEWAQPVTAADGNTYYAWTPAPAGRLLARFSFDDAGNGGLNLLHAAVGQDAIVRATQTTPVAGIGDLTAVTDAAILSGLAAGDGAVAVTNGQYLAVPIPAPLLTAHGRPYTVVMKIRVPNTRGWRSLINMPASNDTDEMAYLQESTRNIYLKQFNKTSGGGVGAANGFVPAEQWATLTFAFGENATDVWLDGRAVLHRTDGTLAGSYADCAAAGGYILVGADDNGDDELYYLSEFRIYEGAVSAAVPIILLPGSGTPADPYVISSTADWNTFASNVCVGVEAAACYRLAADISVTETVGTQDHPFGGTFDGGGHTLTANLSGTDAYLAPFSVIGRATISNLVVTGTVDGNMHCSGLVGSASNGPNVIENCEVAVAVSSSGTHFGGVIGHGGTNTTTLRGCVFSGSLTGGAHVGTFWGWSDDGSTATLLDCLDASASAHPIGRSEGSVTVNNTYYLTAKDFSNTTRLWAANRRGRQAYSVTADAGAALDFGTPSATYATAGITAYGTGLAHRGSGTPAASSGTFYAAQGESVPISLSFVPQLGKAFLGYDAGDVALAPDGDSWTLTMPAADVVVSATWNTVSSGSGTAADPFLVGTDAAWNALADAVAAGVCTTGLHFRLTADVGPVSASVGTSAHPFCGTFDGTGHTLSVVLSDASSPCAAPFACTDGAAIYNLTVSGSVTAPACAGGIVGEARGTLTLENCAFTGTVSGFSAQAGGLVGLCGDALALSVRVCLFAGAFDPAASGTFHPVACKDAAAAVTAAVSRVYYLHAAAPTAAADFLVAGVAGEPVSAVQDPDTWYSPVSVAGITCYRSPPRQLTIASVADWNAFAADLNDGFEDFAGRTVVLAADFGEVQVQAGTAAHPFNGTFDGAGHTITVMSNWRGCQAIFGCISNATVKCVKVTGGGLSGMDYLPPAHPSSLVDVASDNSTNLILGCWVNVQNIYRTGGGCILGDGRSSHTTVRNCLSTGFSGESSYYDPKANESEHSNASYGLIYGSGGEGGTHIVENCLVSCVMFYLVNPYSYFDIDLTACRGGTTVVSNCYHRLLGCRGDISPTQSADADLMSSADLAAALGDGWHVSDLAVLPVGFESSGGRDIGECFGGKSPIDLPPVVLAHCKGYPLSGYGWSFAEFPDGDLFGYRFPLTLTTADGATLKSGTDFVYRFAPSTGVARASRSWYGAEYYRFGNIYEETASIVGIGPNVGTQVIGTYRLGTVQEINGAYAITSAAMLDLVIQGGYLNGYRNHPFVLASDIAYDPDALTIDADGDGVPDSNFVPFGDADHPFTSAIDGAGHTITGIRCRGGSCAGLVANNQGVLSNIRISDCVFSGTNAVGAIAAVNNGTVQNCVVSDSVLSGTNAAGAVAAVNNGTVQNCIVFGSDVSADEGGAVGAVVGTDNGTLTLNYYDGSSLSGAATPSGFGTAAGDVDGARPGVRVCGAGNVKVVGLHSTSTCGVGNDNRIYCAPGETLVVTLDDPAVRSDTYTAAGGTIAYGGKVNGAYAYTIEVPADAAPGHVVTVVRDNLWGMGEGGDGTPEHPYVIRTCAGLDLLALSEDNITRLSSDDFVNQLGVFFELGADIAYPHETAWDDVTSTENNYTPIGNSHNFCGHFDGKGHTVSGIRIYDSSLYYHGLFGDIGYGAEVKNVNIADTRITAGDWAGGIAGRMFKNSTVQNCHVKADVCLHAPEATTIGRGGIAGRNTGGTISHCTSAVKFTVVDGSKWRTYGGIVGSCGDYYPFRAVVSHCLAVGVSMPASLHQNTLGAIVGFVNFTDEDVILDHNYYADCMIDGQTTNIGCGTPIDWDESDDCMISDINDADNPDGAVPAIVLRDGDTNACAFADIAGQTTNVALYALATAKDGEWRTLCLPFSVGDLVGTPLENFAVKELDSVSAGGHATGYGEGVLQLNFRDAPSGIVAGRPCAVKRNGGKILADAADVDFDFIRSVGRDTISEIVGNTRVHHYFEYLVDGLTNTVWQIEDRAGAEVEYDERFVGITYGTCEFSACRPVHVTGYTLVTGGADQGDLHAPKKWTLKAKRNRDDDWTVLDSRNAIANPADALPDREFTERTYGIAAERQGVYRYFRFQIPFYYLWDESIFINTGVNGYTYGWGAYLQLAEFKLQGTYEADIPLGATAFSGVTIGDAPAATVGSADGKVDFVGSYEPVAFAAGDRSSLLLGPDGALAHPAAATTLGACGAWFRLNGLQAGGGVKGYTLDFGDEILSGAFSLPYDDWATLYGLGAWDAADASGIHNVFRYIFDVPTGAITNPPLLSISFDASGNPVIHTPPLNPAASGFDISILASDDLTGTGATTYPLDPSGSTTIPQNGNATRFFRLQVLPHIEIVVPIIEGDDIEVVAPLN